MPAMVFLILTIIQLTMVQHARIMTEYAAFCAARAGIVFNADPVAMRQAALVALMPTIGRTDTVTTLTNTAVNGVKIENSERAASNLPIVSVTVLAPQPLAFSGISSHLNGDQIDFDDIRTAAAQANILQVRVNYYYKMKVPFANQILQGIFMAQTAGQLAGWKGSVNMTAPSAGASDSPHTSDVYAPARAAYASAGVTGSYGQTLAPDAERISNAAKSNLFYFPLWSTYSMRMQSNVILTNAGATSP